MSDFIPKPSQAKIGGLGPKAQKLQALREKAAQAAQGKSGAKLASSSSTVKVKDSFANTKKTTFQRKAV